jgi:hypothetical protein
VQWRATMDSAVIHEARRGARSLLSLIKQGSEVRRATDVRGQGTAFPALFLSSSRWTVMAGHTEGRDLPGCPCGLHLHLHLHGLGLGGRARPPGAARLSRRHGGTTGVSGRQALSDLCALALRDRATPRGVLLRIHRAQTSEPGTGRQRPRACAWPCRARRDSRRA